MLFKLPEKGMSREGIREAVDKFVLRMEAGETFIYHQGFLLMDRMGRHDLHVVAERFYEHGCPPDFAATYDDYIPGTGKGRLHQKRLGKNAYQYGFRKNHKIQTTSFYG